MATISYGADGRLLRVRRSDLEDRVNGGPPAGEAGTLEYDQETNAALDHALDQAAQGGWSAFRVSGGQLTRNGTPVSLTAPGQSFGDRQAAQALWTLLQSGTPLTVAQQQQFNRFVLRALCNLGAF
jgi:hypothetical protein